MLLHDSQNLTTNWLRINHRDGILSADGQVVAFLEFSESTVSLRSRDSERRLLQTTPIPEEPNSDLHIPKTAIPLSAGCAFNLNTNAKLSSDPQLLLQADAFILESLASESAARGDLEEAARQIQEAFAELNCSPHPVPSVFTIFATAAIERLLDIGDVRAAKYIFSSMQNLHLETSALPEGTTLLVALARARLLSFEDNPSEALALRENLRSRLGFVFQESSSLYLWNELRIANLFLQLGQTNRARQILSLADFDRSISGVPLTPLAIAIRTAQANLATLEGQDLQSFTQISSLFAQARLEFGVADPRTIEIESQLGRAQLRQGQTEDALTSFSHVFLWRQKHTSSIDPKLIESELLLSRLYNELGRLDTAYALLLAALDSLDERNDQTSESLKLHALASLASVQASRGDLQQSEETWAAVVDVYSKARDIRVDEYLGAVFNYSLVSILNGHVNQVCVDWPSRLSTSLSERATDPHSYSFKAVLLGLCEGYGAHPETVDAALSYIEFGRKTLQSLDGIDSESSLYCLTLLAAVAIHRHRQEAAIRYLRELVSEVEASRHRVQLDQRMRPFWLSKWIKEATTSTGYASLAKLLAEGGDLEQAILFSELSRNRLLSDISLESSISSDGSQFDHSLFIDKRIRKMDEELSRTPEVVSRVEIECRRQELIRSIVLRTTKITSHHDVDTSKIATQRRVKLERMPPRTAIVSIHHSDGEWWAIVVSRSSGAHFVRFPGGDDLGAVASAWLELRDGGVRKAWRMEDRSLVLSLVRPSIYAHGPLSSREIEEELASRLWIPLKEYIGDCQEVGIVADEDLQRLPLGSLRVNNKFLIDQFVFVYGFSISSLITKLSTATLATWKFDFLGISDDSYFGSKVLEADTPYNVDVRRDTPGQVEDDLPIKEQFARKEILLISREFRHERTGALVGEMSGRELLISADRDGSLQSYRFVHLAAHFTTSTNFLREPVIGIGSGLTATELSHFTMRSDVIVLSGCDTAIGPILPGQGMVSLGLAALSAGNRAAMLTISQVPNDASDLFMSKFYRYLMENVGAAKALALVQREFAHSRDSRMRNPANWGAYIVIQ